jgi:limonene-1,2-epoxide hydrolase
VVRRLALAAVVLAAAAAASVAHAVTSPEQIVRAWSRALNANDNERAAQLFALGARVVQPGVDGRLRTHALAVLFNNALPCAGRIVAVRLAGARVTATFVLGQRPLHRCDAPGAKAAALFVIRNGKIVLWRQVPVPGQPV